MTVVEEVTDDEQEKAREEAEARRAKILATSNDRLGRLVTGGGGGVDDAADGNNDDAPPSEEFKGKGLSKMAAARRRRFKKKDETATAAAATYKDETVEAPGAATSAPGDELTPPEPIAATTEPPPVVETPAAALEPSPPSQDASSSGGAETDGTNTKKYRGVARIRRQMLKEKQHRTTGDDIPTPPASSTAGKVPGNAAAVAASHSPHHRSRTWYTALPILMHAVAVLALFGAGLDVGLQQRPAPTVRIHTSVAPREEFHIVRVFQKSRSHHHHLPSADELLQQAELQDLVAEPEVDEFFLPSEAERHAAETSTIDPLFGVDLDLYTQGDSLYMALARGAIKLHRVNLSIFYYLPLRVFNYAWQTFEQLARSPPLLCFMAIVIRQVLAKCILGASLPKPAEVEPQKDVLTMIKQFVQGFIVKAFPTAVSLYDAWSHLRADMYVVLCGLLVGLAVRHSQDPLLVGRVLDAVADESDGSSTAMGSDEL